MTGSSQTCNGKKVEMAVKGIISGSDVKVNSMVANPECLKSYTKYRNWEGQKEAKL
jgi:acetoacetyl-CoA synthetase